MAKIAPSILAADFANLERDIHDIEVHGGDWVHVDVMDGHFVPNITYGPVVMKSLLGKTGLPFDVHLMIENPDAFLEDFMTPNTEYITVHQEACTHLNRTIQHIKSLGIKAGVSINPATPIGVLEDILGDVDMVLVMSVNPGFGGQKFIPRALDKIKCLDQWRKEEGLDFLIEVDGGVTLDNAVEIAQAGADILVAGSAVFGAADIVKRTEEFKAL